MEIGEHRTETVIKSAFASNETHVNIPSLNMCLVKILQFWKTHAIGYFTGLLAVFVIASFCYIFLRFRKKLTKRYGINNSRHHVYDINSTEWNPQVKGPVILKLEYSESCDTGTENNSDERKGCRVLDVRLKGNTQAPDTVKCNLPRLKHIREVNLGAIASQASSTSVESRKLTDDEWRRAFSTDPPKKTSTGEFVDVYL